MQGIANPFGKPHAGSNPALTSTYIFVGVFRNFCYNIENQYTTIVENTSPPPSKTSRSQQRTRSEILMRAIANENVFLVNKLISEGVSLPSKYDGMDVELYIFNHFTPEVGQILTSIQRKWDLSKIGAVLQSPPPNVIQHSKAWAQFVCEIGASSSLQNVLTGVLTRWKNGDVKLSATLCERLSMHPNASDWTSHVLKTQSGRNAALLSIVQLRSSPLWEIFKDQWLSLDFVKLCDDISRGVVLKNEHIDFLSPLLQQEPVSKTWDSAVKILERNNKKFESFYKKTFGPFANTPDFIASHTALRWKGLSEGIQSASFEVLGLPWWRSVQAQGRAVAKATLGNDVPSQSPRSLDHALLLNPQFTVTANTSPRFVAELRSAFDAFTICQRSPIHLKKMITDLPSLRGWRDECNNNLGHYIAAFVPMNKSLWAALAKRCPQWFKENNASGASVVNVISVVHPNSQEMVSQISQELLKKTVKKATKKAPSAARKL